MSNRFEEIMCEIAPDCYYKGEIHISKVKAICIQYGKELLEKAADNANTHCHCVEGFCNGVDRESILNTEL